jgi:TatD DNase family protein
MKTKLNNTMFLVDTHTHLYLPQFEEDRAAVLDHAIEKGINRFYLPAIESSTHDATIALETAYPKQCFAMMGLHPCSVKENFEEELATVRTWLERRPFCAVGEIGLDLYWDKTFFEQQKEAFVRQMQWAKEFDIPIVIHSRESTWECIELVRAEKTDKLRGIFHCFGGSVEEANAIIDLGFLLGIGGVLTYKKSGLDVTLQHIDLKHLVLETDSPYLAPVPFRGKRNESAYLFNVAQKLAEVKGVSIEEVAAVTTRNALNCFGE